MSQVPESQYHSPKFFARASNYNSQEPLPYFLPSPIQVQQSLQNSMVVSQFFNPVHFQQEQPSFTREIVQQQQQQQQQQSSRIPISHENGRLPSEQQFQSFAQTLHTQDDYDEYDAYTPEQQIIMHRLALIRDKNQRLQDKLQPTSIQEDLTSERDGNIQKGQKKTQNQYTVTKIKQNKTISQPSSPDQIVNIITTEQHQNSDESLIKIFVIQSIVFVVSHKLLHSPYLQMLNANRLIYARQFRDRFDKENATIKDGKFYRFKQSICLSRKEVLDRIKIQSSDVSNTNGQQMLDNRNIRQFILLNGTRSCQKKKFMLEFVHFLRNYCLLKTWTLVKQNCTCSISVKFQERSGGNEILEKNKTIKFDVDEAHEQRMRVTLQNPQEHNEKAPLIEEVFAAVERSIKENHSRQKKIKQRENKLRAFQVTIKQISVEKGYSKQQFCIASSNKICFVKEPCNFASYANLTVRSANDDNKNMQGIRLVQQELIREIVKVGEGVSFVDKKVDNTKVEKIVVTAIAPTLQNYRAVGVLLDNSQLMACAQRPILPGSNVANSQSTVRMSFYQ